MACDEGQEAHLLDLAQRFDRTIHQLKGSFGEIGDQRLTVMAGVMVTDELVALQHKVTGLESEVAKFRVDSRNISERENQIAQALEKTANRISGITEKLNSAT